MTPGLVPAAPRSVTAQPAAFSARLSWTAPATGTGPVRGYTVTARSATGATTTVTTTDATTVSVPGLTNGISYAFTVTATNAVGTGPASAPSNTVIPNYPITTPHAPVIGAVSAGDASATVTWSAPVSDGNSPITGYFVRAYRGSSLAKTVTVAGDARSAVVTGLVNGTGYTFTVIATNGQGASPASARSAVAKPLAS